MERVTSPPSRSTASPSRASAHPLRVVRDRSLYERFGKRILDLVVLVPAVCLAIPLGLVIAFAIRVGLGRGVLYSQTRVGLDGQPFEIVKFRTMRPDRRKATREVPVERRAQHKSTADPRHTGLGRLLRKSSLDELPQLLNVARGEMSFVGPRPEVWEIAEQRGYLDHVRHEVRPGMTGPYQTSDLRENGDLRDGLRMDAEYVRDLSLVGDLRYLARTIGVLFGSTVGG